MSRVFLSYSLEDIQAARRVAASLSSDTSIQPFGQLLAEQHKLGDSMRDSLREADAVVVFLSENSLESPWVQFEYGAALGMGKRVIPVLLGKKDAGIKVPTELASLLYLDGRGLSTEEVASRLNQIIAEKGRARVIRLEILGSKLRLRDVVSILAEAGCNILTANVYSKGDRDHITFSIAEGEQAVLSSVLQQLRALAGVDEVTPDEIWMGKES